MSATAAKKARMTPDQLARFKARRREERRRYKKNSPAARASKAAQERRQRLGRRGLPPDFVGPLPKGRVRKRPWAQAHKREPSRPMTADERRARKGRYNREYRERRRARGLHPQGVGAGSYRNHKYGAGCCDECGMVPAYWSVLCVHHVDGNHGNNALTNLRTLCQNCHHALHAELRGEPTLAQTGWGNQPPAEA